MIFGSTIATLKGYSAIETGSITVTKHTDTVPLCLGSPYRDNWGLPPRAFSVVRELSGSGLLTPII